MEKDLNLFEKAIVNEIVEFNKKEYPFIENHISCLKIKSREKTGVGMYIYFEYYKEEIQFGKHDQKDIFLSSNKSLELDVLKHGLNYELNITKGRFDFMELVTNGESWDGNYSSFCFMG